VFATVQHLKPAPMTERPGNHAKLFAERHFLFVIVQHLMPGGKNTRCCTAFVLATKAGGRVYPRRGGGGIENAEGRKYHSHLLCHEFAIASCYGKEALTDVS